MNLLMLGLTLGVIGKVVLVIAVLRVHSGIAHEHKIDGVVIRAMKKEKWITIIGLALIILGYVLEMVFYSGTPLLNCIGPECAALLEAAFE